MNRPQRPVIFNALVTMDGDSHLDASRDRSQALSMPESYDPYAVLGVSRTASAAQIEAAWKKRIRLLHPDRNADADADEQASSTRSAQRVNRAWQALRDPTHRAAIDLDLGVELEPPVWPRAPVTARAEPAAPFHQRPQNAAHAHVDPAAEEWQRQQEYAQAQQQLQRARLLHAVEHRLFDPRALWRSLRAGAAYLRSIPTQGRLRWMLVGAGGLLNWLRRDRRAQWLLALAWGWLLIAKLAPAGQPSGAGGLLTNLGLMIQLVAGWMAGLLVQWIVARRRCHTPATDVLGRSLDLLSFFERRKR